MPDTLQIPSKLNLFRESFAGMDMLGVPGALLKSKRVKKPEPKPYPIIVMPGLGASDRSMAPMRYFLSSHGYKTEGWGIGANLGGRGIIKNLDELDSRWDVDRTRKNNGEGDVPALCDVMIARVKSRSEALRSKVVLVGWSLGGYVAREVARELPDHVAGLITMGSPVLGGPKYTSAAPLFKARKVDLDWIEDEINKRSRVPIMQPITLIYSKRDGVVGWQAAQDTVSPNVTTIEVNVSHFGMGLNAKVWNIVLEALEDLRTDYTVQMGLCLSCEMC